MLVCLFVFWVINMQLNLLESMDFRVEFDCFIPWESMAMPSDTVASIKMMRSSALRSAFTVFAIVIVDSLRIRKWSVIQSNQNWNRKKSKNRVLSFNWIRLYFFFIRPVHFAVYCKQSKLNFVERTRIRLIKKKQCFDIVCWQFVVCYWIKKEDKLKKFAEFFSRWWYINTHKTQKSVRILLTA